MYPARFDYHRATSVEQAIELLGNHDKAKLLAGGHSLIPVMKLRLATPPVIIDIGRIAELRGVGRDDGTLRVGALTPHAEIAASDALRGGARVLAEAAGRIGDPQVRNRGTIGGNLVHADPASDLPAVALALGAEIVLAGSDGERRVASGDFFLDLLTTDVQPTEVLTRIEFAAPPARTGSAYLKFEHPASGYAVCGAAAVMTLDAGGECVEARLAFNGVAPKPFLYDVSSLAGADPTDGAIAEALSAIAVDDPMSDVWASGDYRVHLARVYGARALARARARARD